MSTYEYRTITTEAKVAALLKALRSERRLSISTGQRRTIEQAAVKPAQTAG